jgi:RNA polymerase sigma-70 factor (ECF subfamily)
LPRPCGTGNTAARSPTLASAAERSAARPVRTSVPLSAPGGSVDGDGDNGESVIEFPVAATQDLTVEVNDVLAVLQTLPAVHQQIIRLSRLEDLTHNEIAARLDMPPGTLSSRLSRATACGSDPAPVQKTAAGARRRAAA